MKHQPKGPGGSWKTGQRCPATGWWRNQFGQIIHLERLATFPPRVGRTNAGGNPVAYWMEYRAAATA